MTWQAEPGTDVFYGGQLPPWMQRSGMNGGMQPKMPPPIPNFNPNDPNFSGMDPDSLDDRRVYWQNQNRNMPSPFLQDPRRFQELIGGMGTAAPPMRSEAGGATGSPQMPFGDPSQKPSGYGVGQNGSVMPKPHSVGGFNGSAQPPTLYNPVERPPMAGSTGGFRPSPIMPRPFGRPDPTRRRRGFGSVGGGFGMTGG